MRLGSANGCGERGDVIWPVVATAVHEECRCPADPAEVRALDVGGDSRGPETRLEVAGEALDVQAEPPGIADEVRGLQCVPMSEQEVVHGPERVLRRAASAASAACLAWRCTSESGRCRHT